MIELEQVSVGYKRKQVINDISIKFHKGTITSIIGKNGCGKTTLIKTASGQLQANSGKIFLCGKNIYEYSNKELAKKVSFLPQARTVPQTSVQNLVLYGRFPYLTFPRNPSLNDIKIAEKAMQKVGIWDYRNKNISELSGGERQKVYIAMILTQDTDIVFLDEPTTYLDINHQLEVLKLAKKLKDMGKTIIMVVHDVSAALCNSDKVCLMDEGKVIIYDCPRVVYESKKIDKIFNVKCKHVTNMDLVEGYLFYV